MVFRAVVFTFLPTAFELVLVCGLLWHAFSWHVVAVVLFAFVLYVLWTVRHRCGACLYATTKTPACGFFFLYARVFFCFPCADQSRPHTTRRA